ncbi:PucR family transcriptional regulator [Sporolactobacillus sp. THM7-7]|nr:PucR family transcriptional regulator [Sporolactobacillus sp. THM7-7]
MVALNKLLALDELKPIHLVAGEKGIVRPVTGVNVTESGDLSEFFKENELIITTGIDMQGNEQRLIAMVDAAFRHQAAGIILNVGPYIPYIPEEVLRFGDHHQFPIFEMPWAYRIADFVRIAVQFIASEQKAQSKAAQMLSDILFNPELDQEKITRELSQAGILAEDDFAIIMCSADSQQTLTPSEVYTIEGTLTQRYKLLLSMTDQNRILYMVNRPKGRVPQTSLSDIVKDLYCSDKDKMGQKNLFIGMGNFYNQLSHLRKSYEEAKIVIYLSRNHPDDRVFEYKDIGAYKLLLEVQNRSVIEKFHRDYLGVLYHYDQLHHTDLVHFLRVFLEEDGHTAAIARKEFIHRNTVLYKIKKIESILGMDLCRPFIKTNLALAFMIEDVIK